MGQIFHPSFNTIARVSIYGAVVFIGILGWAAYKINSSPFATEIMVPREQPVPFSHKHHVEGLGIDCRFCHTSVEESSFAGIPPVETCMKCHSVLYDEAPLLEPIREAWKNKKPIEWNRVHDLPDHVYFDHSVHIAKGVSCVECHGQVNEMPLVWKEGTLHMGWCLDCHRNPNDSLRPKDEVFNMHWKKTEGFEEAHQEFINKGEINKLMNCSTCHR